MKYKALFDLREKTSIVTGGASGLGREMVQALLEYGSNVVIVDNNSEKLANSIEEIKKDYANKIIGIKADVSNVQQVSEMVEQVINQFHKIDILINNAAINQRVNLTEQTYEEWKKIIEVNLNSIFIVSKQVGKEMKKNKKGSIINLSSISGFVANREAQAAYNASKAAIANLTKSLASEWAKDNIRVNAIAPGYMRTEMTEPLFRKDGELNHILKLVPMNRLGEPYELGGTVILLASDASSFTTGSTFIIDGGYTVW